MTVSKEQFEQRLYAAHKDKIKVLIFNGIKRISKFKCFKHDLVFKKNPQDILGSCGCQICGKEGYKKSRFKNAEAKYVKAIENKFCGKIKFIGPYKGKGKPTVWECTKHGEFKSSPEYLKAWKFGCAECKTDSLDSKKRIDFQDKYPAMLKRRYSNKITCITEKNYHLRSKIKHNCIDHGSFINSPYNVLGYKFPCPTCRKTGARSHRRSNDWFVKALARVTPTIKPLEEYVGVVKHIKCKCLTCKHIWSVIPYSILNGVGCPRCNNGKPVSNGETEVYEWVKARFPDSIQSIRSLIGRQELDIVIPSKKIAIEYNGVYWHSTKCLGNDYHKAKKEACDKIGYRLIQIWDVDWTNRPKVVMKTLRSELGLLRYYKQELKVKKLTDLDVIRNFYTKYRIDGVPYEHDSSYGLTDTDGILCSILSLKEIKSKQWCITGFCSKYRLSSKHFDLITKKIFKKQNLTNVLYYANNDWESDNFPLSLGMTKVDELDPTSYIIFNSQRNLKYPDRLDNLKELLQSKFKENKDEFENCNKNGIIINYNSGIAKWKLKVR